MGYKQSGKGDCTVDTIKPMRGFYMILEGSVQSLNELFEGPICFRLAVEILEADDFPMSKGCIFFSLSIEEMYPGRIRGIAIGDEDNGLVGVGSANRLCHGNNGREGVSGVCQMVGRDLQVLGGDKEEDVVVFSHDLEVGFITCTYFINRSLMGHIKAMTIKGGRSGIIQYCLVGDGDPEYGSKDRSGLSGAQGKGDIEGEDKAEDIGCVVDSGQVDGGLMGAGMGKLVGLVMIFPVLIAELELGASFVSKSLFFFIEFCDVACSMKTPIIAAFIDSNLFSEFPGK